MFKVVNKENRIGKKGKVVVVTVLVLMLFIFVIAGWGLYKNKQSKKHKASLDLQLNQQKKSDTQNDETSLSSTRTTNESVYNPASSKITTELKPPTFLKSSGNNGPVPESATINFICQGQDGLDCFIELQDTSNPNNKFILAKKPILSDRSQGFASWDWTSVLGKWNIKAIIVDKEGNTSVSETQTLEVIR